MYAESFNVQSKWEGPAKWLRWAMQGLTGGRSIAEIRYNLRKFWEALEAEKRTAGSPRDWGDIMTMDAQSQWTLAKVYGSEQSEILKKTNDYAAVRGFSDSVMLVSSLANPFVLANRWLSKLDPTIKNAGAQIAHLAKQAEAAANRSRDLAQEAAKAYASAKVADHQAGNTASVAGGAVSLARSEGASNTRTLGNIAKNAEPLPDLSGFSLFSLPWWVWAGGAAVLALALTATQVPRIVAMTTLQKATA